MPKRKRSNRFPALLAILMVAAAGTVALGLYVKLTPANHVPRIAITPPKKTTPKIEEKGVEVLIPVPSGTLENQSFSRKSFTVAPGIDARVGAVNEFLKESGGLPSSVSLLSVNVRDGLAELSFSEGFDSGTGSMDEATLINGLKAVLGQFPEISKFVIYSGGKQIEELGHFELLDPIETTPVSRWNEPPSESLGEEPPPSMPR